ncbi:hypothetical protein IGB42_02718 [Andreprevotia sp. IGB-42]|uniref:hypothetical protein n=1 Tax=Andreprevotia sp. IGB-42 TaxID=2497473 RepID=UPI00135CEFA6|nr:hypothetical protein [Andreprevotia sp. IGB-42]KAF0812874.1 hypothetical protein IGB42_02718 [Andreprevotia sp. IGB-42]
MTPFLRTQWAKLSYYIDAQTMRQRLLMLGVAVMVLVLLGDNLLLRPVQKERARLQKALGGVSEELIYYDNLRSLEIDMQSGLVKADIRKMESDIAARTAELAELRKKFIPPYKTAEMLRGLISAEPKLTLVSMETLPPAKLDPLANEQNALWQHSQRMTLQGDYFVVRNYLRALEQSDWPIFWQEIRLDSDGRGPARATLTFSSLSEDEQWLDL